MAEQNVIQIVIQSVDKMSADLQNLQGQFQQFSKQADAAGGSVAVTSGHFDRMNRHLVPMRSLFYEVSNAVRQLGPGFNTLGSVMDHTAARLFYAGQAGEGFSGILSALISKPYLLIAGVTTLMVVIGNMISGFKEAKKAEEEFNKVLDEGLRSLAAQKIEARAVTDVYAQLELSLFKQRQAREKTLEPTRQRLYEEQQGGGFFGKGILFDDPMKYWFGKTTPAERQQALREEIQQIENLGKRSEQIDKRTFALKRQMELEQAEIDLQEKNKMNLEELATLEAKRSAITGEPGEAEKYSRMALNLEKETIGMKEKFALNYNKDATHAVTIAKTQLELESNIRKEETLSLDTVQKAIELRKKNLSEYGAAAVEIDTGLVDVAKQRLEIAKLEGAPVADLISKTETLLTVQRDLLRTKIEQKDAEIDILEYQKAEGGGLNADLAIAKSRAELTRLKTDMAAVGLDIQKEAVNQASQLAQTFTDRFLQFFEKGKMDLRSAFADLGKTLSADFLQEFIKGLLLVALPAQLLANMGGGTIGGGFAKMLLGLFSGGVPVIGGPGLEYGEGGIMPGNFVPIGSLRRFATGGIAHGPTLGVIGEEGPEIVARMKPARPGDYGGGDIKQNIYLVDGRPPRLGPRDVVLYVAADMRNGGTTANAVQNVIKRT